MLAAEALVHDSSGKVTLGASEFIERYRVVFETLDPERIADFYSTPFLGVNEESTVVWRDRTEVIQNFEHVTAGLRTLKFARATYQISTLRQVSRAILEVPVAWNLLDDQGTRVSAINVVYIVKRPNWLIVAVLGADQ